MVVVPAEIPEAIPDTGLITATVGTSLVHVPPEVASTRVVLSPWQKAVVPVIDAGGVKTVTGVLAMQPAGVV